MIPAHGTTRGWSDCWSHPLWPNPLISRYLPLFRNQLILPWGVSKGTCDLFSLPWLQLCYVRVSRSVVPDSLRPHGLQSTRFLCPWDFPGKDTGVGCHFLLQGIFPTQGSNPGLLHCRQILYRLSYKGSIKWFIFYSKVNCIKKRVVEVSIFLDRHTFSYYCNF